MHHDLADLVVEGSLQRVVALGRGVFGVGMIHIETGAVGQHRVDHRPFGVHDAKGVVPEAAGVPARRFLLVGPLHFDPDAGIAVDHQGRGNSRVEADGYECIREPRQRLMRRAIANINGETTEIRLRNISAMGALAECGQSIAPGTTLAIDIVGVGPVVGTVRWAQAGQFGIQFTEQFDLARLAAKKKKSNEVTMLQPWYVRDQASG